MGLFFSGYSCFICLSPLWQSVSQKSFELTRQPVLLSYYLSFAEIKVITFIIAVIDLLIEEC